MLRVTVSTVVESQLKSPSEQTNVTAHNAVPLLDCVSKCKIERLWLQKGGCYDEVMIYPLFTTGLEPLAQLTLYFTADKTTLGDTLRVS